MIDAPAQLLTLLQLAQESHATGSGAHGAAGDFPVAHAVDAMKWAGWIIYLPVLSTILCGLCAALRIKNKLPAWITTGLLAGSFIATLALYMRYTEPVTIHLFDWFNINTTGDSAFIAAFSLYIDKLTLLWMLFVTGLGTLIALYSSEYMEADVKTGYARFFAGVSVFLVAMSALVLGDNLVMLYLGWEGVGFASYWLIGYYYQRPSAVAAAKKAFIVNRIGDLGLALGLWLTYHYFGTIEYAGIFEQIQQMGGGEAASAEVGGWHIKAIPFLLMLAAFGKSAQIPLYVWLPDAMEGPTPVSALIHAATMVTAGVYLLARLFPVMELHPAALPTVAWIGGLTALLAATIGMAQYDFKRIWAYSTVSQLGYMFLGVGVLTTFGAAYHVFTHAFFKAVLFLTAGAVMHGFAGQLDLRRISGLWHMTGWKIVVITMLVGCLCLAGFPLTSGYFSKDAIIAEAFVTAGPGFKALGWIALITAGLTAYYTFRVWFRICLGPKHYEPGDEHHGDDEHDAGHDAHDFHPHPPRLAINGVLVIIAIGAILAAVPYFMPNQADHVHGGWVGDMVADSSAKPGLPDHDAHGSILGLDPHTYMYYISAVFGIVGLAIAWYFHHANRKAADNLRATLLGNPATRWLPTAMENKWYVDELYHAIIRAPLWLLGHALYILDQYLLDRGIIDGIGRTPRAVGRMFQPLMNGVLQSYAVSMVGGIGLIALLVILLPQMRDLLGSIFGGGG